MTLEPRYIIETRAPQNRDTTPFALDSRTNIGRPDVRRTRVDAYLHDRPTIACPHHAHGQTKTSLAHPTRGPIAASVRCWRRLLRAAGIPISTLLCSAAAFRALFQLERALSHPSPGLCVLSTSPNVSHKARKVPAGPSPRALRDAQAPARGAEGRNLPAKQEGPPPCGPHSKSSIPRPKRAAYNISRDASPLASAIASATRGEDERLHRRRLSASWRPASSSRRPRRAPTP